MRLSQALAREQQEKARAGEAQKWFGEGIRAFQMSGMKRTYTPIDEDGEKLPDEEKRIQHTWQSVIQTMRDYYEGYIDSVATKDYANQVAKADVVIDGKTLVKDAPVPFLLYLEKILTDWRGFLSKMPQRDRGQVWQGTSGQWESEPVTQNRTVKQKVPIVLYEATKDHPAQTQLVEKAVLTGHFRTINHSAELSFEEKERFIRRVDRLMTAVREAREEANSQEIDKVSLANGLLDYIFDVEAS